jgi:hypothetical protein
MRQATPAVQQLARRLLTYEAGASPGMEGPAVAAEQACETLRLHLSKLVGQAGFHALMLRALTLTKAEFSWLEGVQADTEGSLKGLQEAAGRRDAAEATEGSAAVLAHLLGLLVRLIGEALTLRLVRDAWPELPLGDLGSGAEKAMP